MLDRHNYEHTSHSIIINTPHLYYVYVASLNPTLFDAAAPVGHKKGFYAAGSNHHVVLFVYNFARTNTHRGLAT